RFETAPGQQSQIDWGQARIQLRSRSVALHVFILTLGYSWRSFHEPCLGETLSQFLDAHERAFEYFGGHTREHLYDRPRTVCAPAGGGPGRVECDLQTVCRLLGLRAARVPPLPRADEGQGRIGGEVLQAELPP